MARQKAARSAEEPRDLGEFEKNKRGETESTDARSVDAEKKKSAACDT